jgi:hypothetical protein
MTKRTRTIYATTFCNRGHVVETGRPVGHECYILDPVKLKRERDGDDTVFQEDAKKYPLQIVRGR